MEESSSSQKIAAEDPNIITTSMDAHLYKAVANGNINILKNMSEDSIRSQLTPKKNTILHIAALFGQINCLEFTLQFHWCSSLLRQPNLKGDTPLHIAAREGHFEMAKALIRAAMATEEEMESGVAMKKEMLKMKNDIEEETALHLAVRYHHCEVVKLLIEEDRELSYGGNVRGQTPLYMAVERGFGDMVDVILSTCHSADHGGIMGRTVLHAAVVSNDQEMTKKILEWKSDLANEVDENGWSPLHCAAYLGNITILRQLLQKSNKSVVYLRIKDGNNKTALHIAASQGHMDVVKELVLHSPDCCEQVDDDGNNALHLVMKSKKDYVAVDFHQWLSSREVINEINHEGNTPLHLLARSQLDLSFFLSNRKVDKMTFNKENLNAMDIILSAKDLHGNKGSILRRLRNAKASVGPLGWQKIMKEEEGTDSSKHKDHDMVEEKHTFDPKRISETHLIVATLIATVTFAAGFTLPGGYNDDKGSDRGMAVLTNSVAFKAFIITDTIALVLSVSAVCVYFFMALHFRKEFLQKHLILGFLLTYEAMAAMVVAFMTGLYAVLPNPSGIAAATCALCCCFFIFLVYAFEKLEKGRGHIKIHWIKLYD